MLSRTALATALLLAAGTACAGDFEPTRHDTTMSITIVAGTRRGTIDACKEANAPTRVDHPGCAVTDVVAHACTIYVAKPSDADDEATEIVGHEALHCFYGRYHTKPE